MPNQTSALPERDAVERSSAIEGEDTQPEQPVL